MQDDGPRSHTWSPLFQPLSPPVEAQVSWTQTAQFPSLPKKGAAMH